MGIFLIVSAAEDGSSGISKTLEERINKVIPNSSDRFMLPGRNGCFVKFDGISTELRDKLNLSGKESNPTQASSDSLSNPSDEITPAVILNVVPGGYNGYALTTLWEWLNIKK